MRRLPDEIMMLVFYHVALNGKLSDLKNVSLVCRYWNRLMNNDYFWHSIAKEYLTIKHPSINYNLSKIQNVKILFKNTLIVDGKLHDPRISLKKTIDNIEKKIEYIRSTDNKHSYLSTAAKDNFNYNYFDQSYNPINDANKLFDSTCCFFKISYYGFKLKKRQKELKILEAELSENLYSKLKELIYRSKPASIP